MVRTVKETIKNLKSTKQFTKEQIDQFKADNAAFFTALGMGNIPTQTTFVVRKANGEIASRKSGLNTQKILSTLKVVFQETQNPTLRNYIRVVSEEFGGVQRNQIDSIINTEFQTGEELIQDIEQITGTEDDTLIQEIQTIVDTPSSQSEEELIQEIEQLTQSQQTPLETLRQEEEQLEIQDVQDIEERIRTRPKITSVRKKSKKQRLQEELRVRQDEQELRRQRQKQQQVSLTVIDEPVAPSTTEEDFVAEDSQSRVQQVEMIFDMIESMGQQVPENVRTATSQGIQLIQKGKEINESSDSIFNKIKSVTKIVLGFIAVAPLPIPPQIRAGSAAILLGIEAIEQTVGLITGETTDTDAIRRVVENVAETSELGAIAEAADGILQVVDGITEIRDTIVSSNKDKDALDSTPVSSDLVSPGLEQTRQQQTVTISDSIENSHGILTVEDVQDPNASTVQSPIQIEDQETGTLTVIEPEEAQTIAEEDIIPEEPETEAAEIPPGQIIPPADGTLPGPRGGGDPAETLPVTVGSQQQPGFYPDPIHPDALGVYFTSSNFPEWDTTLLIDRKRRFKNLSEQQIKPFILQQTILIWEKHQVDLLIPRLIFGSEASLENIEKENNEILQLWNQLHKIKTEKCKCENDLVGVRIGDLLQMRQLIDNDTDKPKSEDTEETQHTLSGQEPKKQEKEQEEGDFPRHKKDKTENFVYSPSGIRLGAVVSPQEIENSIRPSLAAITTAMGAPPLESRRNLTRGFSHGGPVARSSLMNGIRTSVVGTSNNEPAGAGYSKLGRGIDQDISSGGFNVRTNSSHLEPQGGEMI